MPSNRVLILEIRNENERQTTFSALDFEANKFLWKDFRIEEPWWVSLSAVTPSVLFLHTYQDIQNPGSKTLIALDFFTQQKLWEKPNFALTDIQEDSVWGYYGVDNPQLERLNLRSGQLQQEKVAFAPISDKIFELVHPFQYSEDMEYFDTVRRFLLQKMKVPVVHRVEYMDYNGLIFIGYYCQEDGLANYLLVLSDTGEILLHVKTGERLKGLGTDTFFILSGCLFFVKNRRELISYKIV